MPFAAPHECLPPALGRVRADARSAYAVPGAGAGAGREYGEAEAARYPAVRKRGGGSAHPAVRRRGDGAVIPPYGEEGPTGIGP
jgi:hypothetical protein